MSQPPSTASNAGFAPLAAFLAEKEPVVWQQSQADMPQAQLDWLTPARLNDAAEYCQCPPELSSAIVHAGQHFQADPGSRAVCHHLRRLQFELSRNLQRLNLPEDLLGQDAGMLHLLLLLSGVPAARRVHQEHGVAADIVADTMADVVRFARQYRGKHGCWGVAGLYCSSWLMHHFRGELYRLGRLQFMPRKLDATFLFFRQRGTGKLLALVSSGQKIRGDGQLDGAGGITDPAAWTTQLQIDESTIRGFAVDPARGAVAPGQIVLPRQQWTQVLGQGDVLLDIHIPDGGPMDFASCGQSMARALEFFPQHFPGPIYRGLILTTWFTDPQLEAYLPETSNIIRFSREGYVLPSPCDRWAALRFVFGWDIEYGFAGVVDLDQAPQNTTLERALVQHIRGGGHWRKSTWLIAREDFHWGRQVYRG